MQQIKQERVEMIENVEQETYLSYSKKVHYLQDFGNNNNKDIILQPQILNNNNNKNFKKPQNTH